MHTKYTAKYDIDPHTMRVTEFHTLDHLPHYLLHKALLCTHWVFLKIVKCSMVDKLEHKIEPLLTPKYFD